MREIYLEPFDGQKTQRRWNTRQNKRELFFSLLFK